MQIHNSSIGTEVNCENKLYLTQDTLWYYIYNDSGEVTRHTHIVVNTIINQDTNPKYLMQPKNNLPPTQASKAATPLNLHSPLGNSLELITLSNAGQNFTRMWCYFHPTKLLHRMPQWSSSRWCSYQHRQCSIPIQWARRQVYWILR